MDALDVSGYCASRGDTAAAPTTAAMWWGCGRAWVHGGVFLQRPGDLQTEFDPLNFQISCPVLLKFRCCWKGAPLGKLSCVCNSGVSIIFL